MTTTDTSSTSKVYVLTMTFTGLTAGNSNLVDFAQTSRDFKWEMSGNSGISISPSADNTNRYFQFTAFQVSSTRVTVQPSTGDGFVVKLSVSTSGDVLIGSVNLTAGQVVVAIPSLNQSTIVVAGEGQFSLPLIDNN